MEKKYSAGKDIFFTSLKTMLALFIIFVFIVLSVFVISPQSMANVCNKIGFKRAEVSCLEMVYDRNKTDYNLYNLIVKMDYIDKAEKQNKYILKLKEASTYTDFCDSMDLSVANLYTSGDINGENLSLLYGVNDFLNCKIVSNILKMNKTDVAYEAATTFLKSSSKYEIPIYSFVEYMLSKSVSAETCKMYFEKMLEDGVIEQLQAKITEINNNASAQLNYKIIESYVILKANYTIYAVYNITNDSQKTVAYENWQQSKVEYNNLISIN